MRDLIRADLARVRHNKLLYVGLVLTFLCIVLAIGDAVIKYGDGARAYIDGVHDALTNKPYGALCVVIPIFFAVFSNELQAKSMQCILGHGLTRDKLIIAKLLDSFILLVIYFAVIAISLLYCHDETTPLSDVQIKNLVIYLLLTFLRYYGYIVFSAMIMLLTDSTAAGIVACVFFTFIFKIIITIVNLFTEITLYDYTFDGQLDLSCKIAEAGGFGWQFVIAAIYIAAAVIITMQFYRRKEFEF